MAENTVAAKTPEKNTCAKTVKSWNAYEVWRLGEWTWYVLKKYQSPSKEAANSLARWYCLVDGFALEAGDVYVSEIKGNGARQLSGEELKEALQYAKENSHYS